MMQAAGQMGWSQEQFDLATPQYLFEAYEGYQKGKQEDWERARFMAFYSLMPHTSKRISLSDVAKFPWERPKAGQAPPPIDPEIIKRFERLVDAEFNRQDQLIPEA